MLTPHGKKHSQPTERRHRLCNAERARGAAWHASMQVTPSGAGVGRAYMQDAAVVSTAALFPDDAPNNQRFGVGVRDGVLVRDAVLVAVRDGVKVSVGVAVAVRVLVRVRVAVGVGVSEAVSVAV